MNRVALVTGASAGLGVEFARQLAKRGHALVLAARRKDRLEALAKELGNARAIAIDLSKPNAAAKLMAELEANGDTVDLLVNNAGFGLIGRFAELDAKRQRQMVDLNVGALTDLCRAAAPRMIERKSGGIINLASRDERIALEVNLAAASNAHIKISSKLLSVAQVVKGRTN